MSQCQQQSIGRDDFACLLSLRALTAPLNARLSALFRSKPMMFPDKYSYGNYVFHHFFLYYLFTQRTEFPLAQMLGSHFAAVMLQTSIGITVSIVTAVSGCGLFEKHHLSLKRIRSKGKAVTSPC